MEPPPTPAVASARPAAARGWAAVAAVHVGALGWLFGRLWSGGVLFFRDLSTAYAPDFAVAAGALRSGVWPAWNPLANAGEPYVLAYPVDLLLLLVAGPRAPLGIGALLHLALALFGATLLARRLGMGPAGALVASAAYGLGGFVLSTVNLLQLFEAAAWAPLVALAVLGVVERRGGRPVARLAVLLALQTSTLGLEIVAQSVALGLLLAGRRTLARGALGRLAAACVVAGLLAAPALAGLAALLPGTARGEGFRPAESLAYSVHPVTVLEAVLPRFLGDPHAFSDRDLWGRAFFPEGYPYLLSIYVGPVVLLLALHARRRFGLKIAALVALLVALGSLGPLGALVGRLALPFRGPQKLLFLALTATAILAGFGLERLRLEPAAARKRALLLLPGTAFLLVLAAVWLRPQAVLARAAGLVPALGDPRALVAARELWPAAWAPAAGLLLVAGILLGRGGRWAAAAAPIACLDLLLANGGLNPLTDPSFYSLRPDVRGLLAPADLASGPSGPRFFSYGVANTPGLAFSPALVAVRSDVWLYYLDRQSLLPRAPALDGLPGAFDVDRTGWSPKGATLPVEEAVPERFADTATRLRLAAVRWVLSFRPLPPALAVERGRLEIPEITEPLRLFELRGALPRAFFVPAAEVVPDGDLPRRLESADPEAVALLAPPGDPASGVDGGPPEGAVDASPPGGASAEASEVVYEHLDAHTTRVRARTPPGWLVVLDGHHPDWSAEDENGSPVRVFRAHGRYRAIRTPGGTHRFTFRYRPRWRAPALLATALGLALALLLAGAGGVSEFTATRGMGRATLRPEMRG